MAAKKGFDPVPRTLKILEVKLGRGSFGVVYSATLDKNSVAVKRFHEELMTSVGPGENVPLKNFKTECERLKDLNHPNVVRYIGAYEDKKGPLLVMELMHESLEKYLEDNKGHLSSERVLEMCLSVCKGMAYLHGRDKPLIHRDLGSKNVLLTKEGVVKIADFGQSKLLQNRTGSLMTTQPGTIAYMPPEALKSGGEYTSKVDSFSLGVLILEICTQSGPSSGWDGINYVIEVIRREKDLSLLDDAHPLKSLVVWCLQHEKLRPAVAVIHNHVKNACEATKRTLEEKNATDQLKERLAKEVKSREELEEENLTFKQIIEQFQADFNAERKDREGAAATFADREKEWMEKIRRTGEERDHLKALTTQLQDQTNHQKLEMERLQRELKESKEIADGMAKMNNQEASFKKQEADHQKQVHALHKQLEKLEAEFADKKKDAKGSKAIEEAYRRLFDEKKDLECKVTALLQAKSLASEHIQDLQQQNQTLKAEVEGTRQHLLRTSQELQGFQTQYRALSSQAITWRDENKKLKQRMPTSQHQQQVPPHPIPMDESYQSLPQMPSGPGQVVCQDYKPHPPHGVMPRPQYGDMPRPQYGYGLRPQYDKMQYRPHGGNPHSQDRDLEGKDSTPSSTQPGHTHFVPHTDPVTRTPFQDPRSPPYTGGVVVSSAVVPYTPQTVPGVPQDRGVGRGMLPLGLTHQQWKQQQQQHRQPLPRVHSTPERQETDVSSDSILPSPMTYHPGQHSMTYVSDTSSQPNQRYIGDEINREIRHEARQYKKAIEQGVPAPDDIDVQELEKHPSRDGITNEIKVKAEWLKRNPQDKVYDAPDDIDESIWPFDPNLECPHCGKRFRRGQILEYRYHLDDEHSP